MSTPTLHLQSGPLAGQTFPLRPGTQFIGRATNNDIVIPDPTISKQHAQITVQPDGVWLQDLASANGTFVNGQRLTVSTWLKPGDVLQIGTSVVMSVEGLGGTLAAPSAAGTPGWLAGGVVGLIGLVLVAVLGLGGWLLWRSPTAAVSPTLPPATVAPALPTAAVTPTAPGVNFNFSANKTTVPLGECVSLHWNVINAKEVRLNGESVPNPGERQVCPQEANNTYRLTALTLDGQTKEQSLSLAVPPTLPPPPGTEVDFTADQTTIAYGACATLRWTVKNAQAVRLNEEKVGPEGTKQVCPTALATTYMLVVPPLSGDVVQRAVIINVQATPTATPIPTPTPTATPKPQPQTPVIDKLIADQPTLNQGGCTTLRWTVRNAQSVQLSGGEIGSQVVGNEGARGVCPPAANTTYTLTANGSGGSVQSSITLAVMMPTLTPVIVVVPPAPSGPPKYSIDTSNTHIEDSKRCFDLEIYIENVKAAYLDGGKFNHTGITGPFWRKEVCHKEKTTYTLTVILPDGGQASTSVTKDGP